MEIRKVWLRLLGVFLTVILIAAGVYLAIWMGPELRRALWHQISLTPEERFINMLYLWAQENNGKFPDELSIAAVERLYTTPDEEYQKLESELRPEIEKRITRESEIIARYDELTIKYKDVNELRSMTREQWEEYKKELDIIDAESNALMKEMDELDRLIEEDQAKLDAAFEKSISSLPAAGDFDLSIGMGMQYFLSLGPENEPRYNGTDVFLGDSQTPIFWYKPKKNADSYRVIYGDLCIKEQKTEPSPSSKPSSFIF